MENKIYKQQKAFDELSQKYSSIQNRMYELEGDTKSKLRDFEKKYDN